MISNLLNAGIIGGADGPTQIILGNFEDIVQALKIMGNGMLGIFVVIGLLAIVMTLLSKLGKNK